MYCRCSFLLKGCLQYVLEEEGDVLFNKNRNVPKYYFAVVQLANEIYSLLQVSTANGVSRTALNSISILLKCQTETWNLFIYCQTGTFLFLRCTRSLRLFLVGRWVVVGIFISVINRIIKTESLDFSLVNHDTKHIPNLIQVNSTRLTTWQMHFRDGCIKMMWNYIFIEFWGKS
jgi:hypothetical protein